MNAVVRLKRLFERLIEYSYSYDSKRDVIVQELADTYHREADTFKYTRAAMRCVDAGGLARVLGRLLVIVAEGDAEDLEAVLEEDKLGFLLWLEGRRAEEKVLAEAVKGDAEKQGRVILKEWTCKHAALAIVRIKHCKHRFEGKREVEADCMFEHHLIIPEGVG